MSRLASFRAPSTPSPSPAQAKSLNSPGSPSKTSESTFHRKTRLYLQELRAISETWDDLVLVDGVKAAKTLVDTRTDLDNELALLPGEQPRALIVGPKLRLMEKYIAELDLVLSKLQKQFRKMNSVVDNIEAILSEAHRVKGWHFVHEEVLWVTWTLEKFVTSVASILVPYHRSLQMHIDLVDALRSHSISFEQSRITLTMWVSQPELEGGGWKSMFEDICSVEVERWDR